MYLNRVPASATEIRGVKKQARNLRCGKWHAVHPVSVQTILPGDRVAADRGYKRSVVPYPTRALILPRTAHYTLMEHTWSIAIAKYLSMQKSLIT